MRRFAIAFGFSVLLVGCSHSDSSPARSASYDEPIDPAKLQEWINDLHSEDDGTRLTAVFGLGVIGPPAKGAIPAMIPLLKDQNLLVRSQAAWSLVYLDPQGDEILVHLSLATRDEHAEVRLRAAEALAKLGPRASPSVDELIRLLQDDEPAIRRTAARALGAIGPPAFRARAILVAIAQDENEDPTVQAMARDSIKWIDNQ